MCTKETRIMAIPVNPHFVKTIKTEWVGDDSYRRVLNELRWFACYPNSSFNLLVNNTVQAERYIDMLNKKGWCLLP